MLFVIIAFTAIALVYSAIILAVWWLPKEADPPPINKDEPLSPKLQLIQSMLKVITGIYALLLVPACFIAFIAPFAMVGSGPVQDKSIAFLVMATLPFTTIGSIIVAWVLFRRRNVNIALLVTVLPVVHLVVSYFVPGIWSAL